MIGKSITLIKETISDLKYVAVLVLTAVLVASWIYSYPGTFSCYYRSNDCDFCYLMSAVRLLSGMTSEFVYHPGFSFSQLLAVFYDVLSRLHIISLREVSYSALLESPDLFGYLRVLIWAGWLFDALIYAANGLLVYRIVTHLSRNRLAGFFAGMLSLLSFSTYLFVYKIRPELLSMVLGLASVYVLIRSLEVGDSRWFISAFVFANVLFFQAMMAKILVIPLAMFLLIPLVMLKAPAMEKILSRQLVVLLIVAVLLFPGTYVLYGGFRQITESKIGLIRLVPAMALVGVFMVALLRHWKHETNPWQVGWVATVLKSGAVLLLLFVVGMETSAHISLLPSLYFVKSVSRDAVENVTPAYESFLNFEQFIRYGSSIDKKLVYTNPGQSLDLGFVQTTFFYLVSNRWLELGFIAVVSLWLRKKNTSSVDWALYFPVMGIVLISFSAIRFIYYNYYAYEEIPIIIGVAICMGRVLDEMAVSPGGLRKNIIRASLIVLTSGMIVLRLVFLANMGEKFSICVYNGGAMLQKDMVCLCDNFAARSGLRDVIQQNTGLPCREALIKGMNLTP